MKIYYSEETVARLEGEYPIQANVYHDELAMPCEELLTVAIDDTTNTLFVAVITGFCCH